jgi:endoglucanase
MVHDLGRGINLGNVYEMNQNWNNKDFNSVKSYLDAFIAAGFTHIRMPINWGANWNTRSDSAGNVAMDSNGNPTNSDLQVIKQVVEYITKTVNPARLAQGKQPILLMINTHHENWAMNGLLGSSDYTSSIARMKTIWTGICTIFRDQPDSLLFELFNEPHEAMNVAGGADTVVDMNKQMYGVIRNFTLPDGSRPHEYRKLVIGGINYNSTWGLYFTYSSRDRLPGGGNDRYILGTYHFYNDINTAGSEFDKVRNQFQQAFDVPVIMGEYGTDHRNGVQQSDIDYCRNVANWGVARGFAVTVWDDNGWFQVYRRGSNTWAIPVSDLLGDRTVPPAPSAP